MKLTELAQRFQAIPDDLADLNRTDLKQAAGVGLTAARRAAPVKTGALRDSIQTSVTGDGITIWSNIAYAGIQDARYGFMAKGGSEAVHELRQIGYYDWS